MGHTAVEYGGLIILSRKFKSFSIHHLSGCKSMVDGHIWDVEAGGSNPLTQARGFYFSISLCHPNKENK